MRGYSFVLCVLCIALTACNKKCDDHQVANDIANSATIMDSGWYRLFKIKKNVSILWADFTLENKSHYYIDAILKNINTITGVNYIIKPSVGVNDVPFISFFIINNNKYKDLISVFNEINKKNGNIAVESAMKDGCSRSTNLDFNDNSIISSIIIINVDKEYHKCLFKEVLSSFGILDYKKISKCSVTVNTGNVTNINLYDYNIIDKFYKLEKLNFHNLKEETEYILSK